MNSGPLNLLLADDDLDDCILFYEALSDLSVTFTLTTVHDGYELMRHLTDSSVLPHLLFLDLNMPLKNGLDCLAEIKANRELRELPVIIYSTSYKPEVVNRLYSSGALFYVRKPREYPQLKKVIASALNRFESEVLQTPPEKFVLFD